MSPTILVTGGAGFIGSHLCLRLAEQGYRVRVLDCLDDAYDPRLKEQNLSLIEPLLDTCIRGDIRDVSTLARAMQGVDMVAHLAARAGVRDSLKNPALYASVNVEGTIRVLEAAARAGVSRVVMASSSSVYGSRRGEAFSEQDPVRAPESPYAASKAASELFAYSWWLQTHIPITCARLFTVYGPRQRPNMAMQLFAGQILRGEPVTVFGTGQSVRDYTYVDDIVAGLIAGLLRAEDFRVVNLAGGRAVPLLEVIETLGRVLERSVRLQFLPDQPGDVPETRADLSFAQSWLDYRPQVGIEQGLRNFIAHLR